ncbi:MAG: hypothetical protein JKY93_12740 [Gammaproteobacteria bacterium]|nr:hypothetical protein [Gammaproteobacteria bacterium]
MSSDPKKLAAVFKKSIASLNRRKAFVPYGESSRLAFEIGQLASEIFEQLLPLSPDAAIDALEKLIATGVNSIERCDDSDGCVGDAYQDMVVLWLQAAAKTDKSHRYWIGKIKAFQARNDYGLFDRLLPNLGLLLDADELRQLAFFYETELRRATDSWESLKSSVSVKSIAHALGDCALYERTMLSTSPEPNSMQVSALIDFCLEHNDIERALQWVNKNDDGSASWSLLKLKTYQCAKKIVELPVLCEQLLEREPSIENLERVVKLCPESKDKWRELSLDLLSDLDLVDRVDLLLSLKMFDQALKMVQDNLDTLEKTYYTSLLYLLKKVPDESYLLRVVLTRCLLLNLLDHAVSKAYHHGAGYLTSLRILDELLVDYSPLENHVTFERCLQEKHGRKISFWELM